MNTVNTDFIVEQAISAYPNFRNSLLYFWKVFFLGLGCSISLSTRAKIPDLDAVGICICLCAPDDSFQVRHDKAWFHDYRGNNCDSVGVRYRLDTFLSCGIGTVWLPDSRAVHPSCHWNVQAYEPLVQRSAPSRLCLRTLFQPSGFVSLVPASH